MPSVCAACIQGHIERCACQLYATRIKLLIKTRKLRILLAHTAPVHGSSMHPKEGPSRRGGKGKGLHIHPEIGF